MDVLLFSEEAHTDDVWPLGFTGSTRPRDLQERCQQVAHFLLTVEASPQRGATVLVDGLDNVVGGALQAWPTRSLRLQQSPKAEAGGSATAAGAAAVAEPAAAGAEAAGWVVVADDREDSMAASLLEHDDHLLGPPAAIAAPVTTAPC